MTGAELVQWIQNNHAEDKLVCFDCSAYETDLVEADVLLSKLSEHDAFDLNLGREKDDRMLKGQEIIRIV